MKENDIDNNANQENEKIESKNAKTFKVTKSISSQKSDLSSKDALEKKEKFKKIQRKKAIFSIWDSILSIGLMICFTVSVFMQFKIESRFRVKNAISKFFGFNSYKNYYSREDFVRNWKTLLETIIKEDDEYNKPFWLPGNKFEIISQIRFTKRVVKRTNDYYPVSPLISEIGKSKWKKYGGIGPYSRQKSKNENVMGYPEKKVTFLKKGGSVFNILRNTIDTDLPSIETNLENFYKENEDISSVTVDLSIANYENSFICVVVITNEIDLIGVNKNKITIHVIDTRLYKGGWSRFRLVMEALTVAFLISYMILFFCEIRYRTSKKFESPTNKESKCSIYSQILFLEGLNIAQLITFIFGFISVIMWVIYICYIQPKMADIRDAMEGDQGIDVDMQNKLITAGLYLKYYKPFIIVTFLFMFLRLIHIFSKIVESTNVFLLTISYSISDLFSFFIFTICLLLGFTMFGWVYYGKSIERFNTFSRSLQQNFSFFIGIVNSDIFKTMYEQASVMTVFYFLFLVVVIRFVVIKIILAILLYFYKIANNEYKLKKTNGLGSDYSLGISPTMLSSVIHGYSSLMNGICNVFCCICSGNHKEYKAVPLEQNKFRGGFTEWKTSLVDCPEIHTHIENEQLSTTENETNAEQEKEKPTQNVTCLGPPKKKSEKIDSKDYKFYYMNFDEEFAFSLRNPYFDSESDQNKIKSYYENKYRESIINMIIFLVFIIDFLILYMFNVLSPWSQPLFTSTHENLENIDDIFSFKSELEVKNFLENGIAKIVEGNNFGGENNKIIDDTILFTTKRTEENEYLNNLAKIKNLNEVNKMSIVGVRKEETLDIFDMCYEDKTYFPKNFQNLSGVRPLIWEKKKTYREYGGYSKIFKKGDDPKEYKSLFDPYTSFLIFEFFVKNDVSKMGTYIKLEIKNDYGSYFYSNIRTGFLKYDLKQEPIDIAKFVFEVIFVIMFFYLIVHTILSIKKDYVLYNKWYQDVIQPLNIKIKDQRSRIEPEFLRKLRYILGMSKIADIIVIFLSIGIIYTRIVLWVKEHQFKKYLDKQEQDLYKLRDIFYRGIDARRDFEIVGAIIIFISCVKLFGIIHLGKFFSLLIKTFIHSKDSMAPFIIVLAFIMSCFVFYGHLAFGEVDNKYYKVEKSILNCLKIAFGYADFREFQDDDGFFGPAFFFILLIVINLILLNLFVSILYSSYIIIKSQIVSRIEIYEWKNVFSLCRKSKDKAKKKIEIESSFDYEKKKPKYSTKMIIDREKYDLSEFIKNESEEIRKLNEEVYREKKKKTDVELGYESTKMGINNPFDDNVYNGINLNHLDTFEANYFDYLLSVSEQLEDDVLTLDEAIERLDKHEKLFNYENLYAQLNKKIELTKEKINQLDHNFVSMHNDLKDFLEHKEVQENEDSIIEDN